MRVRCENHSCDISFIALEPVRCEWTTNGKYRIYECPFCSFENWRYTSKSYQKVRGKTTEEIPMTLARVER
jgi:hypothetical protein